MRQGCSTSLLFVLASDPLERVIRAEETIPVVCVYKTEFKSNLYAYDIILTLSNPRNPADLKMIDSFGFLSGYKITRSKGEVMPLNTHIRLED